MLDSLLSSTNTVKAKQFRKLHILTSVWRIATVFILSWCNDLTPEGRYVVPFMPASDASTCSDYNGDWWSNSNRQHGQFLPFSAEDTHSANFSFSSSYNLLSKMAASFVGFCSSSSKMSTGFTRSRYMCSSSVWTDKNSQSSAVIWLMKRQLSVIGARSRWQTRHMARNSCNQNINQYLYVLA